MKKLLLFAGIIFFAFTAKAQSMNFEETVKYIKDKVVDKDDYEWAWQDTEVGVGFLKSRIKEINIQSNGDVNVVVFDKLAPKIKFSLLKDIMSDGDINKMHTWVCFDRRSYMLFYLDTPNEIEQQRLYKAFLHLRTLCTKEKDPFD